MNIPLHPYQCRAHRPRWIRSAEELNSLTLLGHTSALSRALFLFHGLGVWEVLLLGTGRWLPVPTGIGIGGRGTRLMFASNSLTWN